MLLVRGGVGVLGIGWASSIYESQAKRLQPSTHAAFAGCHGMRHFFLGGARSKSMGGLARRCANGASVLQECRSDALLQLMRVLLRAQWSLHLVEQSREERRESAQSHQRLTNTAPGSGKINAIVPSC